MNIVPSFNHLPCDSSHPMLLPTTSHTPTITIPCTSRRHNHQSQNHINPCSCATTPCTVHVLYRVLLCSRYFETFNVEGKTRCTCRGLLYRSNRSRRTVRVDHLRLCTWSRVINMDQSAIWYEQALKISFAVVEGTRTVRYT